MGERGLCKADVTGSTPVSSTTVIGVIGCGVVGTAVAQGFSRVTEVRVHDKEQPSESLESVVRACHVIFVCVPTPPFSDGGIDDTAVWDVMHGIAEWQLPGRRPLVVLKSTVVPGTTDKIVSVIPEACSAL